MSYAYLREHGQPTGSFPWYFVRYLVRVHSRYFASGIIGRDFDALTMLKKVGMREGVELSPEQWEQLVWLWYEPLAEVAKVEQNLKETLGRLKELGLKLGIVSNTFVSRSSLERHLQTLGLLDFFTVQLYSYEFDFRKPNPEIFRIAARRAGEALENIIFVGDRIDKDVRPALANGMVAVLKDAHSNAGKKTPPGAWRIRRIAELPGIVEKINAGVVAPA